MRILSSKSKVILALVAICTLQLLISLFCANRKNYLFFDEVFSYPAANTLREEQLEFKGNEWMDETWISNYMGVAKDHAFQYSIPYENQVSDVHPPLFYLLLHTACSFVPGEFSYWAGMSFNILLFIGCSIVLYFLGKEISGSKECGLLTALLYAVSYGGLNTVVYIRMYMLMTFMSLAHALVYLKYMEQKKVPAKAYILLALTLLGGVLSQYYFLFIAFFFGVWYTIKFFIEKRYQELLKYLGTILVSAICSLAIWPAMLHHLFGGVRGEEAQENLLSLSGYFSDLKEMFRILSNEMFTKLLIPILGVLAILFLLNYRKEKNLNKELWKKAGAVLFVCAGYFLLVTKVAPYQVERYVMPLYPFVNLLAVGAVYILLTKFVPKKFAAAVCVLGFGGLSMIHMVHSGIPYTYAKNGKNIERHAVAEEYGDNYALYISDNGECHWFDPMQMLKEYKGFYHVYDLTSIEETKADMEILDDEENLVVYLRNERTIEEANEFIQNVFSEGILSEENLLDEDEEWNVYLLKLN